jgi:nitroreductase
VSLEQQIIDRYGSSTFESSEVPINKTLDDILDHRTCRRFSDEPVNDSLLNTLLAVAFSAPSKSDLQQRSVIVIRDEEKKRRISEYSEGIGWLADAPVFMVWCGDSRRIRKIAELRHHPFANDHLDTFMNASVDAGIALQTLLIAAESVGLGCCPVSQIRDQIEPLSNELDLPKWVFPVAGLCLGWPKERANISMRLPLEVTVHKDRYDDSDAVNLIQEYDKRREAIEHTRGEEQRSIEQFGISESYGWSEDRSRQYAVPQREDFGSYVRRQGFNLS